MRNSLTLSIALLIVIFSSTAQPCSDNTLKQYIISAHETDNDIPVESQKHYVFFNTGCTPKNILVLYLNGTGANPSNTIYFPEVAANNGFHVINLKYPNSLSAQVPCRNSADINCYENFRKEILEGIDYSTNVSVDGDNCVYNRLLKLLIYLNSLYPLQDWQHYYSGTVIKWDQIVVAGHSQGGGHVAMIGKDHIVKRVLMFASPNDYSDFFEGPALWTSKPHITPGYLYYAFGNTTDEIVDFDEQLQQWSALGLDEFGDTVSVDANNNPYSYSHQLYTNFDPPGSSGNHNSVIVDAATPVNINGTPEFEPVWKYMLAAENKISHPISQDFSLDNTSITHALKSVKQFASDLPNGNDLLLYDITGRSVMKIRMTSETQIENQFQQLRSGLYLYQIISEDGIQGMNGKLYIQSH